MTVGGIGGVPVTGGGTGGVSLTVDGKPVVINGEGGDGLVAGGFPVTIGGPATTPAVGGVGGGTGAGAGDINTSLITSVPEVSEDTEDGVKTGSVISIGPISASDKAYSKFTTIGNITGDGAISGKGASFDFFTNKDGTIESVITSSGGGSYQVGETITISGSLLGGSSPENDVTFEVNKISSPTPVAPPLPPLSPPVQAGIGGVNAGAAGGIDANTPSFTGFNVTAGGVPNTDGLYVPDPNGTELGVVNAVITNLGQGYLPTTTETTLGEDGSLNTKEVLPDPNANYDGEQSYVTSLGDVVVQNAGFEYSDGDTATVSGGSVESAGETLPGDANSDTIQKPGQAQVELDIQNGFIVGAKVTNGGFGFSRLPEITINSDTGAGAKLTPVLNFTKVDDATKLAETTQDAIVTVISCIEK